MFIFAPHLVQTFPELAMRSDSMSNFVKGYLGKKYGVWAPSSRIILRQLPVLCSGREASKLNRCKHVLNMITRDEEKHILPMLPSTQKEASINAALILPLKASMGVALWFLVYSFRDFVTSTVQTTQDTSRYV